MLVGEKIGPIVKYTDEKFIIRIKSKNKYNAIAELACVFKDTNICTNIDELIKALNEREEIMSTGIGFGIAKYASERFLSLIIGGSDPYEDPSDWQDQEIEVYRAGGDVYIMAFEEGFGVWMTPKLKARMEANDREALIAYLSQRESWDFEYILPMITIPCMLFVGENDSSYAGAKKCSEIIPNATFLSLPGLNHVEAAYRTDLTLPHIQTFLAEVI